MPKTLYILDGHYQIHRAFHAPLHDVRGPGRQLASPSGEPTQATYLFCSMLFNLLRDHQPDYLAAAFDVSDETVFRRGLDPSYKANREAMPEPLIVQTERVLSIVAALGIPILRVPGFEADDVIATVVDRLRGQDLNIVIASRDKDLEQLLDEHVVLYDAMQDVRIDPRRLREMKGYTPAQAIDIQTLTGDSTDNVPGVPGIGPKTAVKLIERYGSAEAVLAHADELTPKQAENVKAFVAQLPITRQLVTLRRDVPIQFELEACRTDRLTSAAVRPIFEELGFRRLRETLETLIPAGAEVSTDGGSTPASAPAASASAPAAAGARPVTLFSGVTPELPFAAAAAQPVASRGEYELIDTPERFAQFLQALRPQRTFAFDTETTGLRPVDANLVGLAFAWETGHASYLPVRATTGRVLPLPMVIDGVKPMLEDPTVAKVGQNLKYDVLMLRQVGVEVRGLAFDTMIAAFLLDPLRGSFSLDSLSKSFFGYDKIPTSALIGSGKSQITMDQVPPERVCEYAGEDADFTWRLREVLEPQIVGGPYEKLFYEVEMPLVEVLVEMEHNGVALDPSVLRRLGDALADRLLELKKRTHQAAGHEFNLDSPKQLANVLFNELQLPVLRKTKTGRSTDAETLEALTERTGHPVPALVQEYRELAKLKGTYLDTLPLMVSPRTGRIHASFHQTVAVTGRLSSSDPNLQNIPIRSDLGRRIRTAFVAGEPGNVLLTADYSQIELRLLAHFCRDPALLAAFRAGQDIHRAVAAEVNGIAPDAVTPAQRSAAKAVNFGIIYGQTPFGLSRALGIPVEEARVFIDAYFARYRGIRKFTDQCIADARRKGYAETILGRRRPVPELHSKNRQQVGFGERIAVNTVVQGSAADLIKRAMIDIHQALRAARHPARMLLQVHDELIFEVPEAEVQATSDLVRDKMTNALPLEVPIAVDLAWGRNWYEGK
ncbi:MAG TPA: DNA polymerase I [Phycisphaerae bacterium]|nr:DNA polymerase I [Phycisphaerae bacterium]HNU45300.1 DNA polymerase I [Phycisphaerae bacterium]